jgi:hypothetical protein
VEAIPYKLRSSTNVFINDELVPLDVATSETAMEKYLAALVKRRLTLKKPPLPGRLFHFKSVTSLQLNG